MTNSSSGSVPRQPEEPTPQQVLNEMCVCEPYTVQDLQQLFEDTSRWTIQRRLETLTEDGEIQRKKHSENRVSYWISE